MPGGAAVGGLSLVFRAGGCICALGVEHVVEIMRPLPVASLAGVPPFVCGVCVIRGEPVPLVGLAGLVGAADREVTRYIRVRADGRPLAVAVDAVLGVREIAADSLRECPSLFGDSWPELISAVGTAGGEVLLCLRDARVIPEPDWAAIEKGVAV